MTFVSIIFTPVSSESIGISIEIFLQMVFFVVACGRSTDTGFVDLACCHGHIHLLLTLSPSPQ